MKTNISLSDPLKSLYSESELQEMGDSYSQKYFAEQVVHSTMNSIKTLESLSPRLAGSRAEDYVKSAKALLYQAYDDMVLANRLIK